ncbi:MAG: porin family protein [Anderseniella sp.]|nr:porin family protein [Anderseniella sp.]
MLQLKKPFAKLIERSRTAANSTDHLAGVKQMKKYLLGTIAALSLSAFASTSHAADLMDYPVEYDWAGIYGGGHLGYVGLYPNPSAPGLVQADAEGVMYGFQVGYNMPVSSGFLVGLEADWSGMGVHETAPCTNPAFTCRSGADWGASVRARIGMTMDNVLLYGTGGVAFLNYSGNTTALAGPTVFADEDILVGWTAGAGVEWGLSHSISLGLEGRYSDFGSATLNYDIPYGVDPEMVTVKASINFKLGDWLK